VAADARPDIAVRGVSVAFAAETVLADVSLDIPAGRFVSLIGPSGCGKTTLLKVIGGLLDPAAGTVRYGERSAAAMLEAGRIGLVFQEPSLLPWRTALGNAAFLCEMTSGWSRRAAWERGRAMLELVGLAAAADKYPRQLSGGMRQRVAIARALAVDPDILLMDEPFAALDAIARARMGHRLLDIWQRTGKTVVFVTHAIEEAVLLSDEIHLMGIGPGRIVETLAVGLGRPRPPAVVESPEFIQLAARLRHELHDSLGPDADG
jgi:NitT/TauT family transport system ATP-binding protein